MSTLKGRKLNQLLLGQPPGVVLLSAWLRQQGYSPGLLKRYKASKWLEPVGFGALKRYGDAVGYEGAVYALQKQAGLSVHPGGRTALALLGRAHYLELSPARVTLFGAADERLPGWFVKHDWGLALDYHARKFLPPKAGLVELNRGAFSIMVSNPARAMLEHLNLADGEQDLLECHELMEGLNDLRPQSVQALLEACASVRVNRLFLYLAERAGHGWLARIDQRKLYLGKGKRSVAQSGMFNRKYQITMPRQLEERHVQPGL